MLLLAWLLAGLLDIVLDKTINIEDEYQFYVMWMSTLTLYFLKGILKKNFQN